MRTIRLSLATVLAASGTVVLGCDPAFACSCQAKSQDAYFAEATHVFTGTPTERRDGDVVTWTFDVETVEKGGIGDTAEVSVKRSTVDTCDFTFHDGTRYQVFAFEDGGALRTGICSGTRTLAPAATPFRPAATRTVPAPSSMPPLLTAPATTPPATQSATATAVAAEPVAGEDGGFPAWLAAAVAAAALAAGGGWYAVARRR